MPRMVMQVSEASGSALCEDFEEDPVERVCMQWLGMSANFVEM